MPLHEWPSSVGFYSFGVRGTSQAAQDMEDGVGWRDGLQGARGWGQMGGAMCEE